MELIDALIDMAGNEIGGKLILYMLDWTSFTAATLHEIKKDMNEKNMGITVCEMTLQRHLMRLASIGYLEIRKDPINRRGNPSQYKINLDAVRHGLELIGFRLIESEGGYAIEEEPIMLNELPIDID